MVNQKTNGSVHRVVREAVEGAVWRVERVAGDAVRVLYGAAVYWAVTRTVREAVSGAVNRAGVEDSPHPGFQDFLLVVREAS